RRGRRAERGPAPGEGARQHLRPRDPGRARVLPDRQALDPVPSPGLPVPGLLRQTCPSPRHRGVSFSCAATYAANPSQGRPVVAKKKVLAVVKIQIPAGGATPAPPVGTALGPHGVAIMDFCKEYNAQTEAQRGTIIPVEITIFEDRSFTFITKTPPTPVLLREAAGVDKGSQTPGRAGAGTITDAQLTEIAQTKMHDLNANDLEAAKLQVAGTARSMGITVEG